MGTWQVTPSNGVTYNGNGNITFPTYTGNGFVTYTVKYTDDNGCTGQTYITQTACPTNNCDRMRVYYGVYRSYDSQVDCNNWSFEVNLPYTDCYGDESTFFFRLTWVAEDIDHGQSSLGQNVDINGKRYYISRNPRYLTVEEYKSLVNTNSYYTKIYNYEMESSDMCRQDNLPNAKVSISFADWNITDKVPDVNNALLITFDIELIHGYI